VAVLKDRPHAAGKNGGHDNDAKQRDHDHESVLSASRALVLGALLAYGPWLASPCQRASAAQALYEPAAWIFHALDGVEGGCANHRPLTMIPMRRTTPLSCRRARQIPVG